MKRVVDVAVSTDPIEDYQNIVEYAKELQGYADFLHCDIMNENFVDKNTFDHNVVKSINSASGIMLDCHLMVDEPANEVSKYIDAGANIITLHYEAFDDKDMLAEVISYIKKNWILAYLFCVFITVTGIILLLVSGLSMLEMRGTILLVCGSMLVVSGWFCFFVKDLLPTYYDNNKINYI